MTELQEVAVIQRDRWGRPLVIPPDGGEPVAYTRCTTYVGSLEETYNLGRWQQRMVAVGLSSRPDLLLAASSIGRPPHKKDPAYKAWTKAMNEVCDKATEAAAASASATIGTALHALTEHYDRTGVWPAVPDVYRPHLAAYEEATAGWQYARIEEFCVQDDLRIGGTPDRVVQVPGVEGLVIADLKTGDVELGLGKMAMQLAVYARSQAYDPATGERSALGDMVDLERGLIVSLDAHTGICRPFWIDLAAGWEAVQLAREVRAWRARRGLTEPFNPDRDLVAEARANLTAAIRTAPSDTALYDLWRKAGTAWTPAHSEQAAARKSALQVQGALR